MNIQGLFPLGFTDLISLQSKGPPNVFSSTTIRKHQFFCTQPFYGPALTTVKIVALTIWIFVSKVKSLIFKMLSRFGIAFLSWSTASSDFMACSPGNSIYCVFSFCVLGTCLSPYPWLFIPILYLGWGKKKYSGLVYYFHVINLKWLWYAFSQYSFHNCWFAVQALSMWCFSKMGSFANHNYLRHSLKHKLLNPSHCVC